ncbi:MAG: phosphohydrolase [Firmicutes bacterium HGW-Firmicutes-14]|nr:MAG: phosphohydrolase [Firmicutes bacterium HGW-Firmicutes-14]
MLKVSARHTGPPLPEAEDPSCTPANQCLTVQILKSLFAPRFRPVIDRILMIPGLSGLVNIISLGENQLFHTIKMAEKAVMLPEHSLLQLGFTTEELVTAVLFHDIGKGGEIDDSTPVNFRLKAKKPPKLLQKYSVPDKAIFLDPIHRHIVKSVAVAEAHDLPLEIIEAVALHHHIKITPEVLQAVSGSLALTSFICEDIQHYRPSQYCASGSSLAQVLGILDQLCAIERRFGGKVYLSVEPDKMEDELVKDLIIGVADSTDPRLELLEVDLCGTESVILLDLCSFGAYVCTHSEYQVQAVKKDVLNTIRSLTRVNGSRQKDAVGLIGGDEFVIITPVKSIQAMEKIVHRVTSAIKTRTGLNCHVGFGFGSNIPENFHQARCKLNLRKDGTQRPDAIHPVFYGNIN